MSALFSVRVLNVNEATVDLELTIINADQRSFFNTKSFALMLLIDPLRDNPGTTSDLLSEIPMEDIQDFNLDIVRKKENTIIRKVKLDKIENFPLPPELTTYSDEELQVFWTDRSRLPKAVLSITVKNKEHISHLSTGQQWESGAFNLI